MPVQVLSNLSSVAKKGGNYMIEHSEYGEKISMSISDLSTRVDSHYQEFREFRSEFREFKTMVVIGFAINLILFLAILIRLP